MKKHAERFLKIMLASWGIIFIWALIDGEGDVPQRAGAAFAFAVIIAVLLTLAPLGGADETCRPVDWSRYKPRDTGMISCRKCGYLGAGHTVCPRCGWNRTDKITSQAKMMSCLKCGYLGGGHWWSMPPVRVEQDPHHQMVDCIGRDQGGEIWACCTRPNEHFGEQCTDTTG